MDIDVNDVIEAFTIYYYEIKDNEIICYYEGGSFPIKYTIENEKAIINAIRKNIPQFKKRLIAEQAGLKRELKPGIKILYISNILILIFGAYALASNDTAKKIILATDMIIFSVLNSIQAIPVSDILKRQKQIEKILYFIEHEETINKEIIEYFIEECKLCSEEIDLEQAPVMTVSDTKNMSIKELREIVENIESRDSNQLNLTK